MQTTNSPTDMQEPHGPRGVASGWLQRKNGPFRRPADACVDAMMSELATRSRGFTLSVSTLVLCGVEEWFWTPRGVRPMNGRHVSQFELGTDGVWCEVPIDTTTRVTARARAPRSAQRGAPRFPIMLDTTALRAQGGE